MPTKLGFDEFYGAMYDAGGAVYNVQHPDYGLKGDDSFNNHSALQALIALAGSDGVLFWPAGIYRLGGGNYNIPDGQEWVAAGKGRAILKATAAGTGGFIQLNNNSRVRGLRITSTLSNTGMSGFAIGGARCSVEDCWIESKFTWGCFFQSTATYGKILRTRIEGATVAHGVEINGGRYCSVEECEITGVGVVTGTMNGVEVYSHGTGEEGIQCMVRDCIIQSTDGGIVCLGVADMLITGNRIRSCRTNGISLAAAETGDFRNSINATIRNNVVRDCGSVGTGGSGIAISGVVAATVSGNVFEGNRTMGASINGDDVTLTDNTFSHNGESGINVNGCNRAIVTHNRALHNGTLAGTKCGILVVGGSRHIISENVCTDLDATKVQEYGIQLAGTTQCTVESNVLSGNVTRGFYSAEATYLNCTMRNRTDYGYGDSVRVRRSSPQTIPTGTLTDLFFDVVRFDPKGMFQSNINFMAREPGLYRATFNGRWDSASAAGSFRQMLVALYNASGAFVANVAEMRAIPSTTVKVIAGFTSPSFFMEQGGFCRFVALQDSGGNLDLLSTDAYAFEASVDKVG